MSRLGRQCLLRLEADIRSLLLTNENVGGPRDVLNPPASSSLGYSHVL